MVGKRVDTVNKTKAGARRAAGPRPEARRRTEAATREREPGARELLIRAAVAIAEEDGVGAIGLREAARRAGLTHGAPYRHFESRGDLVAAAAHDGFLALFARCVEKQRSAGPDPLLQFQALGVAYLLFALEHPGCFRVMFGAEAARHPETVRSAEAAVFSLAVNAIASAQRQGKADAGDPQELAMVAWASVHGIAVLVLDGLAQWVGLDASDPERLARRFTARMFDGLRPRKR
ncbi:Transcriptional regulator, TetR family protein [Minicystis rosea]|nr:Transcriptional regulator, TetR family protein [Minicystis rosea]